MNIQRRRWGVRPTNRIQPVMQPVVRLVASCIPTSNCIHGPLSNRFDECLHDTTGCPTGCTTGCATGCIV